MKEVIQKLQELIDTEKEGQGKSDSVNGDLASQFADGTTASNINFANLTDVFRTGLDASNDNFGNLMAEFRTGLDAIQNAIISTAAVSDAQRLSAAMRAEKLAAKDARAQALAAKEARQEAAESQKAQLAGGGATGIDLSSFQQKEGGGFMSIILASITGLVTSVVTTMLMAGTTFKEALKTVLSKRLDKLKAAILKPFTAIKNFFAKIGKFFKGFGKLSKTIKGIFTKIGNFFKGFSKIGALFKGGGAVAKSGGIFAKVFGAIGKLGKLLGKIFAPLGVILGAFAGIFDAVKAFQGEDGNLAEKIIAGISGFFEGFIGFAIGGLLDLGKDLLVWILGIFGVPEEKLQGMKDFSFTDFLKDLVGNIFDAIVGYFKSMFNGAVDGFNNTEGNWADKILGGIMGLINGWFNGLLDGFAKIIDGIAGFFGGEGFSFKDWVTGFVGDIWNGITSFFSNIWEKGKEGAMAVIMAYVNIGKWIFGFVKDIWDKVVGFFSNIFEKGKEGGKELVMGYINLGEWIFGFVKDIWGKITGFFGSLIEKGKAGVAAIGEGMINIGDALKGFVGDFLPDRDSWTGKILAKTGIYDKIGLKTPSAGTDTLVDESAIIPPKVGIGEALVQAGNMTNSSITTVINNNGGNTTNTTTSSQTNNTSSASPPVLSGSAMAM